MAKYSFIGTRDEKYSKNIMNQLSLKLDIN